MYTSKQTILNLTVHSIKLHSSTYIHINYLVNSTLGVDIFSLFDITLHNDNLFFFLPTGKPADTVHENNI